uniref:Uncharacterized protein n=1 Tax=Cacopsylla melanoneura TaxID=428564 RepID=A0A8D9B2G0_9HEMI
MRLVRCYVWSVLLYGMESWILTQALEKKIEALEMYIYRRILKISYLAHVIHVTNVEVLRKMSKQTELFQIISKTLEYYGHMNRHPDKYHLFQLVLKGQIEGRRGRGRRRLSWEADLRRWYNINTIELRDSTTNKDSIQMMIAQLRSEMA